MKFDFHTHTKYSKDGSIDPEDIVKVSIKKGLSGIAITDHDNIKGALKTKKYQNENFMVLIGSEITTNRGEVIGLFLQDEIHSHDFHEVIDKVKDQNGLISLPHPYDDIRRNGVTPNESDIKSLDFIEVFNSRCLRQKYNDKALKFAKNHNLNVIAGSDAHFARELGKAGVVINECSDEEDIRKALLNGNIEVFGKKSSILNLGWTKVIKTWRKTRSG